MVSISPAAVLVVALVVLVVGVAIVALVAAQTFGPKRRNHNH